MTTIYALSSAHGKAGVAVIRLSGPRAYEVAQALTQQHAFKPRYAYVRPIYGVDGHIIDQAILIYFAQPHSFTGEDVVELHVHGSIAVLKAVLGTLATYEGLQLALPGAFTRRAFENGKMDLLAVEALGDLIHAETQSQLKQALRQMEGQTGALYHQWQDHLRHGLALAEALIDFAEDEHFDNAATLLQTVHTHLETTLQAMQAHLFGPPTGERIRHGLEIAIVGAPNVGKSSLLNWLAQRPVAIVSEIAGTTRDVIDVSLDIGGYAVTLRDTAGMHEASSSAIEQEGMHRAQSCAEQADIRLFVASVDQPNLPPPYQALCQPHDIFIMNKADLTDWVDQGPSAAPFVMCSIQENAGMDTVLQTLTHTVTTLMESASFEFPVVTRARHREHLTACANHIRHALAQLHCEQTLERAAQDIRFAVQALAHIMGTIDVEQVLDDIFAQFCIGK